jgi:hypothetical protein
MGKQMSSRLKLGLIVTILVLAAVLATLWVIVFSQPNFPLFGEKRLPPSNDFIPGDLQFFYDAFAIISTVNIAFLVILTLIYVNVYIKTHSTFTIGLVIFALVFLVKDLTSSPLVISLLGYRAYGLGPFELLPGLFEFFALSVLLYLSIRY